MQLHTKENIRLGLTAVALVMLIVILIAVSVMWHDVRKLTKNKTCQTHTIEDCQKTLFKHITETKLPPFRFVDRGR